MESAPRHLLCITRSAAETRRLGRALARQVQPGDLLCLLGELGAGKTTFLQGLGRGLGVPDTPTSPSFTLVHEHRGRLPLLHLDLFRVHPGEFEGLGLEEILSSGAVVAVEWGDRLPGGLCEEGLVIQFRFAASGRNVRQISFWPRGPRGRRMLEGLEEQVHARSRD